MHPAEPLGTTGCPPRGHRGPEKLAQKFWPKIIFLGRFLAQNSAQWAKCSTGSAPFPHKVRGALRGADPPPHRSTFRAYSMRDTVNKQT